MSIVENLFNKELINLPDRRHYLLWAEMENENIICLDN